MLTSPPRAEVTDADRREARSLPLSTRFTLGETISPVQQAFLDEHGYLVFANVLSEAEVARVLAEIEGVQERWLAERREEVHGIPVVVGKGVGGEPFIQRFPFSSLFSEYLYELVRDERFAPVRSLVGKETRVGDHEKDGLVFNRNLNVPGSAYPRLGWHTDGLRDLFLNREIPGPMLNVGLHFDRIRKEDGGLRIIPGSHRQGFWDMLTRKPYFISHGVDPDEIAVETEPGDLTVHDGRTWHRVEQCPHTGIRSLRRTCYVPYLTDAYAPKTEKSKTPFYHSLAKLGRELKGKLDQVRN
ncbi:MAG: phytanoyl-CoA dioxygenase [Sandaracinus sp.]|nr:phytanoyl-CoA dioxygenase [Sandaracinus sp.]